MPKIKVKGQTVQTGECPQTHGRTHTHSTHTHTDATKRIIAPATRSVTTLDEAFLAILLESRFEEMRGQRFSTDNELKNQLPSVSPPTGRTVAVFIRASAQDPHTWLFHSTATS